MIRGGSRRLKRRRWGRGSGLLDELVYRGAADSDAAAGRDGAGQVDADDAGGLGRLCLDGDQQRLGLRQHLGIVGGSGLRQILLDHGAAVFGCGRPPPVDPPPAAALAYFACDQALEARIRVLDRLRGCIGESRGRAGGQGGDDEGDGIHGLPPMGRSVRKDTAEDVSAVQP